MLNGSVKRQSRFFWSAGISLRRNYFVLSVRNSISYKIICLTGLFTRIFLYLNN